ncbi:unnamed protein product [Diatraea saccharalis]|uniref:Spondin-1-like n=1 Tax=Diatraea saccharalis TaxID=40085 RepID=A0A9N9QYB4_9NEOP|nr:unnamed protein product [Diatraea saccharalis]
MAAFLRSAWVVLLLFEVKLAMGFRCDRRPYGSTTTSSPPDVQITETDGQSRFIGFMISAEGDTKQDPKNPRRMISQYPGEIRPQSQSTAKFSDRCLYSVEQSVNSYKSSVEVYWQAPSSGNGCVTLRAMVAENENVWFEDGGPLTLKVCEDMRQPDDVSPQFNDECTICDEAKYEISFTGIWSRNTHPNNFPENDWIPRYSDMVGASHTGDFILWTPGTEATEGLKQLAEHANSSKLEEEILEKVGDGVRTLIKGKGHSYLKMNTPTYSFFRTNKDYHLVSVAIGIYPSPDWFLGVARFELCQQDNTWLRERELNLFPWDAGTDSGVSYESPKIQTFPQDTVSRVQTSSYDKNSPFFETDMKDLHPFGRLSLKLIRTYQRECEETTESEVEETTENTNKEEGSEEAGEPIEPSRYQNPELGSSDNGGSLEPDPESTEDCPMTPWQEWSSCEGNCVDGKITSMKWRERYHLVDGIPIGKYDPNMKHLPNKEVSKYCEDTYEHFEDAPCEEDCSEIKEEGEELTAEQRIMAPVIPGHTWSKKRALAKSDKIRSNV